MKKNKSFEEYLKNREEKIECRCVVYGGDKKHKHWHTIYPDTQQTIIKYINDLAKNQNEVIKSVLVIMERLEKLEKYKQDRTLIDEDGNLIKYELNH